jgi:hypothetical protein
MPAYHVPQIDHASYPARCRRMSDAELMFTIADCRSALEAMPDGTKAGFYADEIHYANAELQRRAFGGKRQRPRRPTVDEIAAAAVRCALDLAD